MNSIIMDIDGVVSRFAFALMIKKYFGVSIPNSKISCYSIEDCLGVSPEAVTRMFAEENKAPPVFVPGAIESLKYLMAKDYDIYILSDRLKFMGMDTLVDWIERWHIPYSAVVTADELPSYVYAHVDDSPAKLMSVRDKAVVKHSILFSNPWNKNCLNIENAMDTAKNWKEVRGIIDGR